MKTYVITISQQFPATFNKAGYEFLSKPGDATGFIKKIMDGTKIHTIRGNYALWAKRFVEIEKGNACLSVRVWNGKPYRSKQDEVFNFRKSDGIGVQRLHYLSPMSFVEYLVDGAPASMQELGDNDGLGFEDFAEWFTGTPPNTELAIIHFTPFRY